jgi:hypothetical protein
MEPRPDGAASGAQSCHTEDIPKQKSAFDRFPAPE